MTLSFRQHMRPWFEHPIVVVDFETCGIDPAVCMPVEMALVRFEGGDVVDRYSTLINPGVPIPEAASAIHGIVDADVADAPTIAAVFESHRIDDLIGRDAIPCAYNAPFDSTIFYRFAPDWAFSERDGVLAWLDPLVLVRDIDKFVSGSGRHRLAATCARHGVELEPTHRALADAEACGRLLFKLKDRIGNITISELLRKQALRAAAQETDRAAWLAQQKRESA